jgi:hypothetical protein
MNLGHWVDWTQVWNTVEVLWEWMQRCNFTGVWATVGELIAARQIVEIVGDNKRCVDRFVEILWAITKGA